MAVLARDPHQFGRAAANVEDHRGFGARLDQWFGTGRGEMGFRLAVDDLENEARLFLDALRMKCCAVFGRPAGFGRDQPGAADLPPGELVGADPQGLDGAQHGRLAQPAGMAQSLAQANDAGEGVDDGEAGLSRDRDQQPTVVGAQIEGPIILLAFDAPGSRLERRRTAIRRSMLASPATRAEAARSGGRIHDLNLPAALALNAA